MAKKDRSHIVAIKSAFAEIAYRDSLLHALQYAINGIGRDYDRGNIAANAHSTLCSFIYDQMNRTYRDLFMWVSLSDQSDAEFKNLQKQARKLALARFLHESMSLRHYLDFRNDNQSPYDSEGVLREDIIKLAGAAGFSADEIKEMRLHTRDFRHHKDDEDASLSTDLSDRNHR